MGRRAPAEACGAGAAGRGGEAGLWAAAHSRGGVWGRRRGAAAGGAGRLRRRARRAVPSGGGGLAAGAALLRDGDRGRGGLRAAAGRAPRRADGSAPVRAPRGAGGTLGTLGRPLGGAGRWGRAGGVADCGGPVAPPCLPGRPAGRAPCRRRPWRRAAPAPPPL